MPRVMIRKNNGKLVPFDEQRIHQSLKRAGISPSQAKSIVTKVKKILRPKITTDEIYSKVHEELKKIAPEAGARYTLKTAVAKLGPAGFNFEKYVASILSAYGYKTELPYELQGACVTHEVDVIAEKEGRRIFIEAKFRNNFQDVVNIKDTMSTWARFLDLVEGAKLGLCPHFDEAWIVTNGRFTKHSLNYGHCKNMHLIGWNHPKERSFASMVDLSTLYPITVIEDLTDKELQAFISKELSLCREITELDIAKLAKKTGLSKKRLGELQKQCKLIITN